MINSRNVEDLTPMVQLLCNRFLGLAAQKGHLLLITSTYRDNESQDYLYAQGRTRPGAIVTKAKGGQSPHNYRVAFDVCPMKDGKLVWNDTKLWEELGALGKSVGLEWGGDWKFKDMPHFQEPGFKIPTKV